MDNIGKEMSDCFDKIIEQHPLSNEFETDARTIWPKRWQKLKALNKIYKEAKADLRSTIKNLEFEIGFVKKANEQLQAENKKLKDVVRLILNENFSGQSTLSHYAKRQADGALKNPKKFPLFS